jgi:hypothetical protein
MYSIPLQYQPVGSGMSFASTVAMVNALRAKRVSVGTIMAFDPAYTPLCQAIRRAQIDNI